MATEMLVSARRMVRVGYRHPHNNQIAGATGHRYGIMVAGYRARRGEESLLDRGPHGEER